MNWFESLYAFKLIAAENSFSGGARKLNINPAKATILIQQLEKKLNAVLFIRTTRRLSLTEAGHDLLKKISPLLEEWETIRATFTDKTAFIGGNLRIGTVPDLLSIPPFSDWITAFLDKYPKCHVDLKTFSKPLSLMDESLDVFIGIESYIRDPAHTVAQTLFPFNYACFASPKYLKKYGTLKKPEALSAHNCVIYVDQHEWSFKTEKIKVEGNFRADNGKTLFSAGCQGIGIIRVPDFMAKPYVENKTLAPILKETLKEPAVIKLFYPKLSYQPRKVKEFITFLVQRAGET